MLENQSTNELLRLPLLGEDGNQGHLCTQQKVSVGWGDTGIVRKAKGESNIQFLGQTSPVLCPQTNSQQTFARSLEEQI